jgi:hypothetical protein
MSINFIILFTISIVSSQNCGVCCQNLIPREPNYFTYYQNTGRFFGGKWESAIDTIGYSGINNTIANGRNNPQAQCVPDTGPAPATNYVLGKCTDFMHGTAIRPCSFPMIPIYPSQMCLRFAMFIHGCNPCNSTLPNCDYTAPPCGDCSNGCIIIPRTERMKLREGDFLLVVQYDPDTDN